MQSEEILKVSRSSHTPEAIAIQQREWMRGEFRPTRCRDRPFAIVPSRDDDNKKSPPPRKSRAPSHSINLDIVGIAAITRGTNLSGGSVENEDRKTNRIAD